MARVFLARDGRTGAEVVVKRLREERAQDPVFRRLFRAELRVMKQFRHPYAVALLDDSGVDAEVPYFVLEHVPGISLDALVEREGRLGVQRSGALLGRLCVVLQAAHDQAVLHRDLTAANVMVVGVGTPAESLKVMDFGLARLGDGLYIEAEKLQTDSSRLGGGTPDYVCPELVRGEPVDARGDLYSVGVLLYRTLTGHLPFESERDVHAILLAHRDRTPPAFAEIGVHDVPAAVEAVVQACLAKDPARRPQSARELAESFGAAIGVPIADPQEFHAAAPAGPATSDVDVAFAPESVIERFEAWMPEQIAAMKLRGFIQAVGGTVLDSLPGLIRVRLNADGPPGEAPTGFWGWLRGAPRPVASGETIELHLHKKPAAGRSVVDIVLVRPPPPGESYRAREAGLDHCRKVSRELRAYLMIGH